MKKNRLAEIFFHVVLQAADDQPNIIVIF